MPLRPLPEPKSALRGQRPRSANEPHTGVRLEAVSDTQVQRVTLRPARRARRGELIVLVVPVVSLQNHIITDEEAQTNRPDILGRVAWNTEGSVEVTEPGGRIEYFVARERCQLEVVFLEEPIRGLDVATVEQRRDQRRIGHSCGFQEAPVECLGVADRAARIFCCQVPTTRLITSMNLPQQHTGVVAKKAGLLLTDLARKSGGAEQDAWGTVVHGSMHGHVVRLGKLSFPVNGL